jgi:hypothetical protein
MTARMNAAHGIANDWHYQFAGDAANRLDVLNRS